MSTALDATALIYAMEANARRPAEQDACARVHAFVDWLKVTQREEIQIPAPALAEFLAFYGDTDQAAQVSAVLAKGFRVTETDFNASVRAANIWIALGGREARKKALAELDISKQCVKTDILIVATALAHGAKQIITVDKGVVFAAEKQGLRVIRPEDCVVAATITTSRQLTSAPRAVLPGFDEPDDLPD